MFDYLWVIPVWILSFVCHEYMHLFEHLRQGNGGGYIKFRWWHGLPSMGAYLSHPKKDAVMVSLAGGLYTSLIHLLVLVGYVLINNGFVRNGFTFAVVGIGLIQFFYGYFEALFSGVLDDDEFFVCHYLLYFVVGFMFCIVWFFL